jgi:ribose/xylose/arabinose/galactoside ABC-type transport system permease subunit
VNRLANLLLKNSALLLAVIILAVVVATSPAFRRPAYWAALGEQYFSVAILALALTPVILTGGIDLSVGSVTVCSSVVIGFLWKDCSLPIGLAVAGGIVAGALAGLANGSLVTLGVMPLVATLATRELFRGLALCASRVPPVNDFPPGMKAFWDHTLLGAPVPVLAIVVVFVFYYLLVHHTWYGRALFAIGDNETAARFAAVPVRKLKLALYALTGLMAGLCGAGLVCRFGSAKADVEQTLELSAIACVVLGGIRITGGSGRVWGTAVGTVTIVALSSGLNIVSPQWRDTITGGLVVAVAIGNELASRLRLRGSGIT